jgi:hypothetical protein
VVDTIGTNGRARPINGYVAGAVTSGVDTAPRLPASDQLHVTERIRLAATDSISRTRSPLTIPRRT